jgi:hypothetical protein
MAPAVDSLRQPINVAARRVVEFQHPAHKLQNGREMPGLLAVERYIPAPANVEEMAVQLGIGRNIAHTLAGEAATKSSYRKSEYEWLIECAFAAA